MEQLTGVPSQTLLDKGNSAYAEPFFGKRQKMLIDMVFFLRMPYGKPGTTPNVDLQATISEVRPDGKETFVQNGWIRASERKLSTTSSNMFDETPSAVQPIPTFRAADEQPMPAGEFVPVTIPLYFEGHVYRAGSRIRITISAPNGSQPIWSFSQTQPEGSTAQVSIKFGPGKESDVTLPVVPGVSVPTGLPACPSLRNEPCREYQPYTNEGA